MAGFFYLESGISFHIIVPCVTHLYWYIYGNFIYPFLKIFY